MASEILGLFTTPEQYQLAQQQAQQAEAAKYAQLDPRAQAQYGFYRGGQQLAGAIGGALGIEDPQLKIISNRQALASQLDPNNLDSYKAVVKAAMDAGDQQFAMAVADAGRKAQADMALIQQRTAEKMTNEQRNAMAYASQFGAPDSLEYKEAYQQRFDELTVKAGKQPQVPSKIQEAERVAVSKGFKAGTPEYEQAVASYLERPEKPEPRPSVGSDREAFALDVFDKNYYDLNKDQRAEVNKRVDAKRLAEAKATAPASGIKEYKDIPKLRSEILGVIDPFRKAVNATDFALESLNLSINANNFSGFNAARVQLAKALSGGDLSQKEIAAAGGDPSILGGLVDVTSTAFTGTPSFDTQNKIKNTINAIRKVALKKGNAELNAQRAIAKRSGFNEDDFNVASDIPEFKTGKGKKTITLKSGKTVTVEED